MLSSLPKLADRSFILGMFLPTLLFAIALLFEFRDQPLASKLIDGLGGNDLGQAIFLLLAVWVVAVLMLVLNHPLYRLLEGYYFPSWLGEWIKSGKRRRFQSDLDQIKLLHEKRVEARKAKAEGAFIKSADFYRYQKLRRNLAKWMPSDPEDVLPTDFGNAIRAFEVYPFDIYGADGVVVYSRLTAVIPKAFSEQISDMRNQIDFLLNCWLFSTTIAFLGIVRTAYSAYLQKASLRSIEGISSFIFGKSWVLWIAGGLVAAVLFYWWARSIVPAWGDLVKSAFDCYLLALSRQMGFDLPASEVARREFWTTFSQQAVYGRGLDGKSPFRIDNWKQLQPVEKPITVEEPTAGENDEAGKRNNEETRGDEE